jgi:hypothetical protein
MAGGANASGWLAATLAMVSNKEAVVSFMLLVELDFSNR